MIRSTTNKFVLRDSIFRRVNRSNAVHQSQLLRGIACAVCLLCRWDGSLRAGDRILDSAAHHLGDTTTTSWTDAPREPEGKRLDLKFRSSTNTVEWTLSFRQRDLRDTWILEVNDQAVTELKTIEEAVVRYYPLPPGTLHDGQNTLTIRPKNKDSTDDIAVGPFKLWEKPLRETMPLVRVRVRVLDEPTLRPLPARITLVDLKERFAEIFYATNRTTAVREGIVYTRDGDATFDALEGEYILYATRGMEWSRFRQRIRVSRAAPPTLEVTLRREVDTTGFVAADTHIHTFTISKHGDATLEERMITIAAEGVELAVATDHNHHTDYTPYQREAGLTNYFTPVVGNEVSTSRGHFNAFPLDPHGTLPDHKETNWVKLISDIRTKGAKVVILNHPRWPDDLRQPFRAFGLNQGSGDRMFGSQFTFDAMELVNSTALEKDPLYIFRDWFSLLNHGERISAVGSSDSHTVFDPVGQGRTYVRSSTDNPALIDVDEVCANFVRGDTSVSLGMFADVTADGVYRSGQTVPIRDHRVEVALRVQAPSWIDPQRAVVFLNGIAVAEADVPTHKNRPTDARLSFKVPTPPHDAYLVCVALGAGVKEPSWKTYEDYTLAATNPIFLDVNGDGRYSSPRETARMRLGKFDGNTQRLRSLMASVDSAVAVQMTSLARADLLEQLDAVVAPLAETNKIFELYQKLLPPAFK